MNKTIVKSWTFSSSSNPNKHYETLQYEDGSTSCNCMGWTRQVKPDGSRTCTHTRKVEAGLADDDCVKFLDLTKETSVWVVPTKPPKPKAVVSEPVKEEETPVEKTRHVVRRITW